MTESVDLSRQAGYLKLLAQAQAERGAAIKKIYGAGSYSSTVITTNTDTCSSYCAYVRREFPYRVNSWPNGVPEVLPDGYLASDIQKQIDDYNSYVSQMLPHVRVLNEAKTTWVAKKAYFQSLKTALYYWKDWNISLHDFIDTGIISKNDASLASLEYNGGKNIKKSDLAGFLAIAARYPLYNNGCKVKAAQTAEERKQASGTKASQAVSDVLESLTLNKTGAREAIETMKTRLTAIDSCIQDIQITLRALRGEA